MKRTLFTALALAALAQAETTPVVVDPSLASSEAQTTAEATVADPMAATTIPEENLPELKEDPAAERNAYGVFFDVNAGTQGIGFNAGYEFNRYLKLRFRASWLGYKYEDTWNDMDMSAKLNGNSTGLLLDVHPFAGAFHISAGFNFAPLSVEAHGSMNNLSQYGLAGKTYTLGNTDYRLKPGVDSGWVKGEYKWRTCQPYLGIGWSSNGDGDRGLYFSFDLGVNFMGSGNLSVSASSGIEEKPTGAPDTMYKDMDSSSLRESLLEEGKDIFKIADKIFVYPVLQIGIGYRF